MKRNATKGSLEQRMKDVDYNDPGLPPLEHFERRLQEAKQRRLAKQNQPGSLEPRATPAPQPQSNHEARAQAQPPDLQPHEAEVHPQRDPVEEYSPDRKRVHEDIVGRLLHPALFPKPTAYIFGGGLGTGKTTLRKRKEFEEKLRHAVVLDVAEVRQQIPEYASFRATDAEMADARVHEEARHIVKLAFAEAVACGYDLVYESTCASPAVKPFIELLKCHDYTVQVVFVDAPPEVAFQRLQQRGEPVGDFPEVFETDQDVEEVADLISAMQDES